MNPFGSSPLVGIVCWWPFDVADIPPGWLLCDGENGTPNMRGNLAIGAPDGVDSGAIVGSDSHVHDTDILSRRGNRRHTHFWDPLGNPPNNNSSSVSSIPGAFLSFPSHSHSFSGNTAISRPQHRHSLIDDTEAEDSKQLSREQIFIMKT